MKKSVFKERDQEKNSNKVLQEKVGLKIRQLREREGISQTELAIRMNNRDRQVVQRLEQGRTNCSLNLLRLVSEALAVDVLDLFKA
jgi:ribosome-binding protein aMBF1 (putative translation factor)